MSGLQTTVNLSVLHVFSFQVESVLTSLVPGYATAERMEESGSWRHPIDVVTILENGFKELPAALEKGKPHNTSTQRQQKTEDKQPKQRWHIDSHERDAVVFVLLGILGVGNVG
jgi:hypothetical protein